MPCWWKRTQTPISGLKTVSVEEIVGSASGSGWQFLPDWTPLERDSRFEQVLESMRKRGFDHEYTGTPIELIRFQNEYWVSDGHRRISASRNLGIRYVRAEITLLPSTSSPQANTRVEASSSSKTTEVT
jgi:hypothetical protein